MVGKTACIQVVKFTKYTLKHTQFFCELTVAVSKSAAAAAAVNHTTMEHLNIFICLVTVFAISTASVVNSSKSNDSDDVSLIQSRILNTISKNGKAYHPNSLVVKVACIVDTLDGISVEYRMQPAWNDLQQK